MSILFRNFCLCAVLIVGVVINIQSEEIDIQGNVIDESGNPVKDAQVKLCKNKLTCLSGDDGNFLLNGNTGINQYASRKNHSFIGIKNRRLQLGDYYNSSISVFSINGAILNNITLEKQNCISIDNLIPSSINSQTLIIRISAGEERINLKTVKCGSQWLWNEVRNGSIYHNLESASAAAVDTLKVSKSGKQTYALPISSLVANLAVIILYDDNSNDNTPSMIGDVDFSEHSKSFKSSFTLTMSTKISNAEIRYTTDGKLPTATSTLYDGKNFTVSKTTQLRAAAFVGNVLSGKSSSAIYIQRNFDYTSEIPIIIMEGYGGGKPKDKYHFIDLAFMTFEPVNGVADINNPPTLVSRAGYHLRGQSSKGFKQSPYRIELWDNDNKDVDYPVLGMPPGSDWALISPCTDNTLIRNVLIFDLGKAMGLATVQYRFAEVFINQDDGALEKADNEGIYALVQPIKNRKNTLNLKKLKPDDTDPAKLSGGYIFKFDQAVADSGMLKLECTGATKMTQGGGGGFGGGGKADSTATCYDDLELVDPPEPNQQQIKWITDYIQQFHDALHAKPAGDWQKYVDMNSFVNNHIINEVTRNVDAWIRSHYMYKDRDNPIKVGPVWDYNFAMGNMTDMGWGGGAKKTGWHILDNRTGSGDWHTMMWKQPEYKSAVKNRYLELRKTILSDDGFNKLVDDCRKPLMHVAIRNFEAWPMGKCYNMGMSTASNDTTWEGQIDSLKIWTKKRLKTLDSLINTLP
ncbi:MAG TPA: CotH kinase family protein [Chitinispirillaceae bacterium]|nr:CotH kinase family protein [Chitinispirillaceae bacterium]